MPRSLVLVALLAACSTPRTGRPIEGLPERQQESRLGPKAESERPLPLESCLYVLNSTQHSASIWVEDRHVGWIGPESSAAFFVGRSSGPVTTLRAVSEAGEWWLQLEGPVWDFAWYLQ